MKRYCMVKDKNEFAFSKNDSDFSYDVNVGNVIGQQEANPYPTTIDCWFDFLKSKNIYKEVKYELTKIKETSEFLMDIINEVYLSLDYLENKSVKLFLKKGSGLNDEINEAMNITRKNIISGKSVKQKDFIFDIDTYLGSRDKGQTLDEMEIPEFGNGVVKLWLSSANIRRILGNRGKINEKHKIEKILNEIESKKQKGINFSDIDAIILERLFGVSLEQNLENVIRYKLIKDKKVDEERWDEKISMLERKYKELKIDDLIKAVMKYHGEYVRSYLVQMLAGNINNIQLRKEACDEKELIKKYTKYLEEYADKYNTMYKTVHDKVLKKYGELYSVKAAKQIVQQKRIIAKKMLYPTMLTLPCVKPRIKENIRVDVERLIQEVDFVQDPVTVPQNKIAKLVDKMIEGEYRIHRMSSFYFEYERYSLKRPRVLSELASISQSIEKTIIEGNRSRYAEE